MLIKMDDERHIRMCGWMLRHIPKTTANTSMSTVDVPRVQL